MVHSATVWLYRPTNHHQFTRSCPSLHECLLTNPSPQLLIALMKKQHLPYESAENGLEALNKFKQDSGRYFLVFMDMVRPSYTHTPTIFRKDTY
jgi:hypothetical protein